ncbi:hypothetical protein V5O48_009624 [Marasmius crinis-equi]|uniref:Uncharacterized protein n=1 Tax=Marasmius crinis-equi TaxID=585013 RepID=A0ABR3FAL0_9AGAR
MSAVDRLFTKFLCDPPKDIDLNALGGQCGGILEALSMAATLLFEDATRLVTICALDKYWPRVWHWIRTLGKAAIENPHPLSSDKGITTADRFAASVANFVIHPSFRPDRNDQEFNALIPLIKFSPVLLAFMMELWLWTAEVLVDVDPTISQLLMHTIYMVVLNYETIAINPASWTLKAEIEHHLSRVLQNERCGLDRLRRSSMNA